MTEESILALVRQIHWEFGLTSLCLAGGVALNSVANGRILRETPFEELYVQPSPGDWGGALGAAQVAWHYALGNSERFVMDHVYWGESYQPDEIRSTIEASGLPKELVNDESRLVDMAVDRLIPYF